MLKDFPENEKGDDFLNEFRQKIANNQAESIEDKRNDLKRSKSVFLGAVSGMVLALAVGWFILSPRYESGENAELPVARKPQAPIKIQPAEPGGMEILNQDKSVYDIIEKKPEETKDAQVLPPPEQPSVETIETLVEAANIVETATYNPTADTDNKASEEIETITIVDKTAPVVDTAEYNPAPAETAPEPQKAIKEEKPVKPMIETPPASYAEQLIEQTKAARNLEKPKAEPVKSEFDEDDNEVAASIPAGVWQLQLMASPNKPAVEKSWNDLLRKHKFLAKHPYEIERADLGAKGVFYRLKVGSFKDRAGADTLCNELKSAGGTCIVKKK